MSNDIKAFVLSVGRAPRSRGSALLVLWRCSADVCQEYSPGLVPGQRGFVLDAQHGSHRWQVLGVLWRGAALALAAFICRGGLDDCRRPR
jgi:hypothetical protein